jgi:hypothetical protein
MRGGHHDDGKLLPGRARMQARRRGRAPMVVAPLGRIELGTVGDFSGTKRPHIMYTYMLLVNRSLAMTGYVTDQVLITYE